MKKLLIVLAILLVAGAGAFAQEVSVSGSAEAGFTASITNESANGVFPVAQIDISGAPSENTSVSIQLDNNEGHPWDSGVLIDDWRVNSSLLAEMGIDAPVSVNLTFGYFDTYMSNFSYVTARGKAFWNTTNWSFLGNMGPSPGLAWLWDIGFGDFGIRYYNTWYFGKMAASFYGSVAGMFNFIAGYASDYSAIGDGTIYGELSANLDLGMATLFIPGNISYNLGGQTFGWSAGVSAGIMDMVTVAVEVGGDTANDAGFEYIIPQITATPVDGLSIYADAVVQLPGPSAFKSVDLGASYMVGPLKVNPGFVIGIDDTYSTALREDGGFSVAGTGLYVIFATSF